MGILFSPQALEAMVYSGKKSDVKPGTVERTEVTTSSSDVPTDLDTNEVLSTAQQIAQQCHEMPDEVSGFETVHAEPSMSVPVSKKLFPAPVPRKANVDVCHVLIPTTDPNADEEGNSSYFLHLKKRDPSDVGVGLDRGSAIVAELQNRVLHDQHDRLTLGAETVVKTEPTRSQQLPKIQSMLQIGDKATLGSTTYRSPRQPPGPVTELEMQRAILQQPGAVISTRVLLRKCPKFRINGVMEAMRTMSQAEHYVGEMGQIQSHVRVFYKCPPQLIQPEALQRYGVTLEDYMFQFDQNPQPIRGGPTDWESYVTKLMEHAPYNVNMFPLEKMGLDGGALKRLRKFREQLEATR